MHTVFLQWFMCVKMIRQIQWCCVIWWPAPGSAAPLSFVFVCLFFIKELKQLRGQRCWSECDESQAKDVLQFQVSRTGTGSEEWGGVGTVGFPVPVPEAWADRNSSVWAPAGLEWMWSRDLRWHSALSCRDPLEVRLETASEMLVHTNSHTHTSVYFHSSGGALSLLL